MAEPSGLEDRSTSLLIFWHRILPPAFCASTLLVGSFDR